MVSTLKSYITNNRKLQTHYLRNTLFKTLVFCLLQQKSWRKISLCYIFKNMKKNNNN